MKHYTWNGQDCLMVKTLKKDRCTGCLFSAMDQECPHTDPHTDVKCDSENDIIFIKNTPKAIAEYMAERLK